MHIYTIIMTYNSVKSQQNIVTTAELWLLNTHLVISEQQYTKQNNVQTDGPWWRTVDQYASTGKVHFQKMSNCDLWTNDFETDISVMWT